jgi:small-conductance mechanosensitive channel
MKYNIQSFGLFFVFIAIVFMVKFSSAQIPIIDQISKNPLVNDSIGANKRITLDNVNNEIEFTDNLIFKKGISESMIKKQNLLIQKVDSFNLYLTKQGKEFREFEPDKLTHFFLNSARTIWQEYNKNLKNYRTDIQKLIRESQELQSQYIKNKISWEESLPDLKKNLSVQIVNHINSNLGSINQIINNYDLNIRTLIATENKILQNINFIDNILNDINDLSDKRKAELFKRNDKNIFSTNYQVGYSGTFRERLKLAVHDNTKNFGYFYTTAKSNLITYIILIFILVAYFLYIRKQYRTLNNTEINREFFRINRIVIQNPILTIIALILIFWTVIVPYSPLVLSLFVYLATLIILIRILSPIMDPFIRKIELAVILLLTLSNFEVFVWYFGNYSRIYLLIESVVGIILTIKYVFPSYKIESYKNQNKKLVTSVRVIAMAIFTMYFISLVSNLMGFVNLSTYSLKVGVYTGVISMLVHGFYRITTSIIYASVDVINISYPEIIKKYGSSIHKKSNRFLKLFLGFLWISGILRISEVYESVSSQVGSIFTDKVKIGSLTFTFGNLVLFIATLYFTYIITKFVKQIVEREVLSKQEMKRGVAASISLTIRIFIVFFGTLVALSLSGLDFGKIGIIAGALSVGIGFGLQNIVSNFISGLILVYGKPVQEGDTIEVDTLLGRVSNIGIRSSTITTYDGADVVVPNSNLISNQLINWTLSDNKKRVEIKVGTSYGSDPNRVIEILLNAALSNEKVIPYPEPMPLFVGFGDNSLNFRLLFWVHFEDGLKTQSDVAIKIYNLLKENNIEIPFPQLDLHIKNEDGKVLNNKNETEKDNLNT